jgi:SagB-type dehydrogenase family enzyme
VKGRAVKREVLFRRAPCLVSYWEDGDLVFENYATGDRISAEPLTSHILDVFDEWRPIDALTARLDDYSPQSLRRSVAALERHNLLHRSGAPADGRTAAMKKWGLWNPAAGFFHASTKDVRYERDLPAIDRRLRQKARQVGLPPRFKQYRHARQVRLPKSHAGGPLPTTLLERRTWREFGRAPLSRADLGTLLWLTWGVHDWLELPGQGRMPLKTSPSGGARHPIEVYVLARRVADVPPGLYHYRPDRHRLALLRPGATLRQILSYLPSQTYFGPAAALMLMTAVFERTQWKYDFARAYRVVLAEAGHLCQTFCLVATWLGLAPFETMALADSRIERDLGIDGVSESVLYAAGVGTRRR